VSRTLCLALVLAACGGDGDDPPLSDAITLQCPTPGDLPFRLESRGFQRSTNQTLAERSPRFKDEASDVLGNPDGAVATVYLDNAAAPAPGLHYQGLKARTRADQGLFSDALPGEAVSVWFHDDEAAAWVMLDRGVTDDDGHYDFDVGDFVAPNGAPVFSVLEADGSCASHRNFLLPSGSQFVVMDIDGTLTTDDNQILMQVTDETYVPAAMIGAAALAQAWDTKGYPIVYLTARDNVFDSETRGWLDALDFPPGAVITANSTATADAYKTAWLERLITDFGWVAYAAYGNADTDITAYENVAIPKDRTFIIGPNAGNEGTVAIPNGDYTEHIATFVETQPDN
jgi:hypothetical protein